VLHPNHAGDACSKTISMNEKDLLEKIRENPDNFSELFKTYYKQLFGYILRRTGDFDATADIAADTFLKSFQNIKNFRYTGISVKVWLYRIATNEVNMYFRNRQRHSLLFQNLSSEDRQILNSYLAEDRKELESELEKHEQFLSVLKELKTLPLKYQEVISLRYFEGRDNKEISEILNINEGTLKSLLSRGIEKLRKKCNHINL
jgi:RNA polymerase sigma-70 factor, ECF subfamily